MLTSMNQNLDMGQEGTAAAVAVLLGKSWISSDGGERPEHKEMTGSIASTRSKTIQRNGIWKPFSSSSTRVSISRVFPHAQS
jgi:hypothetical protein